MEVELQSERRLPPTLVDLPVELLQKVARMLRPGDGTMHAARYAMSPLRALDKNQATERGIANILNLALANKWLYATLRPVYWEHPIQPTSLDIYALKRLYHLQPSVLPFIQSLDLRDGEPRHDELRKRKSGATDLRYDPIIVLSRVAKEMPNIRSMTVNAVTQLPIDYTCWPALTHLSLNFASFPNSESIATLLSFVPRLQSLEFGRAYGIRRTPQKDKEDNFGYELRLFGRALDDLPASAWSMKPFSVPADQQNAEPQQQDHWTSEAEEDEEDEGNPDPHPMMLPPGYCTLFEAVQKMPKLEHLILNSESYLRTAHWPAVWTSPPHLRSLTLTLNTSYQNLEIILRRFSDSIDHLQLCISSMESSWWTAHDNFMALPECRHLRRLEFVQYAGSRVAGPTLRMFRNQSALETVRTLYRSGEFKQNSYMDVEESPDLEDLQQLAIDPDALPGLRRLVIRNIKPFRFEVPFEALFNYGQTDEEQMAGHESLTRPEITQLYQQSLVQEGWPPIRCKKALRGNRDLDEARQWLIENLETPNIDDDNDQGHEDKSQRAMSVDVQAGSEEAKATAPMTDDLQMAIKLQEADQAQQLTLLKDARNLARTVNIIEQLRLLFSAREPPVEFMCWPEGRDSDECD